LLQQDVILHIHYEVDLSIKSLHEIASTTKQIIIGDFSCYINLMMRCIKNIQSNDVAN